MSVIARINAGMPEVNGNGQPTNEPAQQPVIHLVTTREEAIMQAIHNEMTKLNTDEPDTAQDAATDTPAT
jgi:hypothetical protein